MTVPHILCTHYPGKWDLTATEDQGWQMRVHVEADDEDGDTFHTTIEFYNEDADAAAREGLEWLLEQDHKAAFEQFDETERKIAAARMMLAGAAG